MLFRSNDLYWKWGDVEVGKDANVTLKQDGSIVILETIEQQDSVENSGKIFTSAGSLYFLNKNDVLYNITSGSGGGGGTVTQTHSISIEGPTSDDLIPMWYLDNNSTVTKITAIATSGTSNAFNIRENSSVVAGGGNNVAGTTVNSSTNGSDVTVTTSSISSGKWIFYDEIGRAHV